MFAMLSFIGYVLFVYRYLIEQLMPGIAGAVVQTVFVLLLVGAWQWSLFSAVNGSRRGLIGALICTSLPALFTLYDLIFYSPVPYGWPLLQISVWATFTLCSVAIAALAYQLSLLSTAS
jgi:hypothetical protein